MSIWFLNIALGFTRCLDMPPAQDFQLSTFTLRLFYFLKDPAPPDPVVSVTKPDQRSLSYDMIFRHIAPVAAVKRIVTVISHHPIIIHLESISRRGFIINEILTVLFFQFIAFIGINTTMITADVFSSKRNGSAFFRNPDRAIIIYRPAVAGFVRKYERALVIFSQGLRYNIFYSRKHF